ncbi:hypothetical protein [Streptomyces aidingensis]|uniref:Uncharacterized protein n=1 Tax=Streptomyces aidingensis TaxID=910347 RepID=A0A1I1EHN1_9ACTN|nr:hypothetical protein [Streptomyces aidingensis]SFB84490.1 hypothetical protein SAMN05421773_101233 [Streptomyces aidingensis]
MSAMSGGGGPAVLERPARAPDGGGPAARRGRRFDPARFLLGLCMLLLAAGFTARAAGWAEVPLLVLVAALPLALLLTAAVALTTHGLRRRADRRRRGAPPPRDC